MVSRKLAAALVIGLLVLATLGLTWPEGQPRSLPAQPPVPAEADASPVPSFGPLLFANNIVAGDEGKTQFKQTFQQGITSLYAFWPYTGVGEGSAYKYEWYRDNKLVTKSDATFEKDTGYATQAQFGKPLPPGLYRFVLRFKGQAALSGECVIDGAQSPAFGPVNFTNFFNEETQEAASAARVFPLGTPRIYGYWAFSGVEAGSPFSIEWFQNGESFATGEGTFPTTSGLAWQSTYLEDRSALPAGPYQLVVKTGSKVILRGQCAIDDKRPAFGPAVFSSGFDEDAAAPTGVSRILPLGTTRAYAAWRYSGVGPGDVFQFDWYYQGQRWGGGENAFEEDIGRAWQWLDQTDDSPLEPGIYQVVITYQGKVVLAAQCIVSASAAPSPTVSAQAAPSYGPLTFSATVDPETNEPLNPSIRFPYGTSRIYAYWPYEGVRVGDVYSYQWTQDGNPLYEGQGTFEDSSNAVSLWVGYADGTALDPGKYKLVVKVNNRTILSGESRILNVEPPVEGPYGYY